MAYYRAGRVADARQALAQADQTIDRWIKVMVDSPVGILPILWFDFIEFRLLHREAHWSIYRAPLPEDPRLTSIEQRALAAIRTPEPPLASP